MNFIDLLNEFHIMPQFPPSVMKLSGDLPSEVSDEDLKGRTDLTDKLIITIDGDDAKDFDDAISLERLENGNYSLGVHIADVTHYVKENSPIDRAAFMRGTSVYLIDTVIPMLPFELSNELCSLKPGVVRLTVSVFMEIDKKGIVRDYKILKSFIKSKYRMTYNNVTKILEGDKTLYEKYQSFASMLKDMRNLADILNKKRQKEGSLEFVTHESKITLDEKGRAILVEKYPITISNNIIEEFMLCANVTVAKHLRERNLPCVYRVHESPDFDSIQKLAKVLSGLDVDFRIKPDMIPRDFQNLLKSVSSFDTKDIVNYLVLRSMKRARYSEKNLGHFGLSFSDYCHFTSPIRRYPDIVVHRVLKESIDGSISEKRISYLKELAISASVTASMTEYNAQEAEFKWKDIKKAEYIKNHIGEVYMATITHITGSGFFAELESTVEGFVAARTIEDDLYMMSENGLYLEGMRKKKRFTLGDKLKIKVVSADADNGKIDFEIVGKTLLKPQKSNRRNLRTDKKILDKNQKKILRQFNLKNREEKTQKRDVRSKADSEKWIFENAVIYALFEILLKNSKLTKTERNYIGTIFRDLAAVISMPVYKMNVLESKDISLENAVISARKSTGNTIEVVRESFGVSKNTDDFQKALMYVSRALRHFDQCLKEDDINFSKREHQYESILRNLYKGGDDE